MKSHSSKTLSSTLCHTVPRRNNSVQKRSPSSDAASALAAVDRGEQRARSRVRARHHESGEESHLGKSTQDTPSLSLSLSLEPARRARAGTVTTRRERSMILRYGFGERVETECVRSEVTIESVLESHGTRARVRWRTIDHGNRTGNVPESRVESGNANRSTSRRARAGERVMLP